MHQFRVFEVRGNHLEYKPPEVKSTNIHKLTKATINRNKQNEDHEKKKKEVKEEKGNFKLFYKIIKE
jgi:hypothetical protein